jgi:hypothetical protein
MKPLHTLATAAILGTALNLAACGGGTDSASSSGTNTNTTTDSSGQPVALALTGATSLTLVPTELGRVEVSGGTRPYTAASNNTTIALASVSDSTLSVAAVRGDTTPATVTVTDAKNAKVTLTVNVTNSPLLGSFTLSPSEMTVSPGATRNLTITGGTPPFTVVAAKPTIASAAVSGNVVTVTGVSEGVNAELRVIDSKGVTQTATVTVAASFPYMSGLALFSNMPFNLTLRPNTSRTFTLGGGTGPYSAVSSNPAAVATTVRGGALILDAGVSGSTTLTITDNTGQTFMQTVRLLNTSAPLTVVNTSVTGMVGTTTTVGIAGGLPPYRSVNTSTTQVGKATVINSDSLQITFLSAGAPMRISVLDAEDSSVNLDITATAALSGMVVSPSKVTISERLSRSVAGQAFQTQIPLVFVNARLPLHLFTSHPHLLAPTISLRNAVTVNTLGDATSPLSPCVDADTDVTITGIDASGASASTTITITDNGVCPI